MGKRIIIFSSETKDREQIGEFMERYLKKEFSNYFCDIQIQKFYALNEPKTENQIGHWGEILIIFDRRICPNENRFKNIKGSLYFRTLKTAFDLSKKLCEEKDIPYIIYKGEITKKEELELISKIDWVKDKIKSKLEKKIDTELSPYGS